MYFCCFASCLLFVFFFLLIRRPPRSTRTDTLFPYTTLFRSQRLRLGAAVLHGHGPQRLDARLQAVDPAGHATAPEVSSAGPRSDRKSTRSELQSLMRISYAVFCLKKKKNNKNKL